MSGDAFDPEIPRIEGEANLPFLARPEYRSATESIVGDALYEIHFADSQKRVLGLLAAQLPRLATINQMVNVDQTHTVDDIMFQARVDKLRVERLYENRRTKQQEKDYQEKIRRILSTARLLEWTIAIATIPLVGDEERGVFQEELVKDLELGSLLNESEKRAIQTFLSST